MKQFPAIRDMLLFLGGLSGVFHETVLTHTERPTLLILFAAMMGLPAFLRSDESNKQQQSPPQPPSPPQFPPLPVTPPQGTQYQPEVQPPQLPPTRGQPDGS